MHYYFKIRYYNLSLYLAEYPGVLVLVLKKSCKSVTFEQKCDKTQDDMPCYQFMSYNWEMLEIMLILKSNNKEKYNTVTVDLCVLRMHSSHPSSRLWDNQFWIMWVLQGYILWIKCSHALWNPVTQTWKRLLRLKE